MRCSILVFGCCATLLACDQALIPTKASVGGSGGSGSAALAVTPTSAVIPMGGTVQLLANGSAAAQGVFWRSNHTDTVAVAASGLVTGVSPGQAVVTATSSVDTTVKSQAAILVQ